MGGSAFKDINISRYTLDEYNTISNELVNWLKDSLGLTEEFVKIPKHLKNKTSFGDIDIIICYEKSIDVSNIIEKVDTELNSKATFKNGDSYSFEYKGHQVDFIFEYKHYFEHSVNYHSYNDLFMYIGKMAHSLGLKLGQKGLYYFIYSKNRAKLLKKYIISRDVKTILNVLGLDYQKFIDGFDDYNDVFSYVVSSKYFTYNCLDVKLDNNKTRKRDEKRNSHLKFKEWSKNLDASAYPRYRKFSEEETIEFIENNFPTLDIRNIIKETLDLDEYNMRINKKFNGDWIRHFFPSLGGEELGIAIKTFRESLDDYKKFIDDNDLTTLIKHFGKVNNLRV